MKFNKLKTKLQTLMAGLAICLFVISCNDEQSANNSTPGADESKTDTSTTAKDCSTGKYAQKIRKGIDGKGCRY